GLLVDPEAVLGGFRRVAPRDRGEVREPELERYRASGVAIRAKLARQALRLTPQGRAQPVEVSVVPLERLLGAHGLRWRERLDRPVIRASGQGLEKCAVFTEARDEIPFRQRGELTDRANAHRGQLGRGHLADAPESRDLERCEETGFRAGG